MNVICCKDWYIGTEKMMEKEDVTVCRSLCKVAVSFLAPLAEGQRAIVMAW